MSAIRFLREADALTLVFEVNAQPVARLSLPFAGSLSFRSPAAPLSTEASSGEADRPDAQEASPAIRESQRTLTLSGRLKTQPRAGKPDRSGNPTAWARFAAHIEGEREAHSYLATFHRHTTGIALGLAKEAAITVEGYAHPQRDPNSKSLDTFSVFNIVSYPGKTERRRP